MRKKYLSFFSLFGLYPGGVASLPCLEDLHMADEASAN